VRRALRQFFERPVTTAYLIRWFVPSLKLRTAPHWWRYLAGAGAAAAQDVRSSAPRQTAIVASRTRQTLAR
jgi:hypothetical protein